MYIKQDGYWRDMFIIKWRRKLYKWCFSLTTTCIAKTYFIHLWIIQVLPEIKLEKYLFTNDVTGNNYTKKSIQFIIQNYFYTKSWVLILQHLHTGSQLLIGINQSLVPMHAPVSSKLAGTEAAQSRVDWVCKISPHVSGSNVRTLLS